MDTSTHPYTHNMQRVNQIINAIQEGNLPFETMSDHVKEAKKLIDECEQVIQCVQAEMEILNE
jgi:exodeoxyribonuclease VII small subunit